MKFIILIILFIQASMACDLSIPLNDVDRALNPPVSGHYLKCEEFPDQPCLCLDGVNTWYAELYTEFATDPDTGINIGKKVLRNSPEKKAIFEAKKLEEEEAEKSKLTKMKTSKDALKSIDIDGANTVAKLKAIVKLLLEAQE